MGAFIDLTGKKFGKLMVSSQVGYNKYYKLLWLCLCHCGGRKIILGASLQNGRTKSCGCIKREQTIQYFTKHGNTSGGKTSREYRTWQAMKTRCNNPNYFEYHLYGGRGIKVCDRWLKFENFLIDMGKCPKSYTIDRINVDGNYESTNCRWATPLEQSRNKRCFKVFCSSDKP